MKSIVIVLLTLFTIPRVNAQANTQVNVQNTYLDALRLSELMEERKKKKLIPEQFLKEVNDILIKYNSPDLSKNPFIEESIYYIERSNAIVVGGSGKNNNVEIFDGIKDNTNTEKDAFGTTWQSAIISGTSDFMAERFSAEIMHMGLNKAIDQLSSEELVKVYFPKSQIFITKLKDKPVYTTDLKLLRQIIQSELENLPKVLIETEAFPSMKDEMKIGYEIFKNAKDGYNIFDIIENVGSLPISDKNLNDALKTMFLFSTAFQNKEGEKNLWVNPLLLKYSPNKTENLTARMFYGLLYEQLKTHEAFKDKITKYTPEKFVSEIQKLGLFVNYLNQTYSLLEDRNFVFKNSDDVLSFSRGVLDGIQTFLSTNSLGTYIPVNSEKIKNLNQYILIAEPFLKKDYQKGITLVIVQLSKSKELPNLRSISLITDISEIENAEDMKKLLEAYALPIGSSSIKRNSSFNISLNGYVGFTGGAEKAYGKAGSQTKTNLGLTAPIGISMTVDKNWTLFGSIIDLGSIVNVRLNNNTTQFDNLRFEHFLAPGVGVYYNFTNYPVTLGVHYNYIPNLRNIEYTVDEATVTETNVSVSRLNASVLIDIPLFTLFHKEIDTKKK